MAETTDELGFVERVSSDLHAAHLCHITEEGHELLGSGVDGARGRIALVAGEGDACLDGDGGFVIGK